jgi:hypothetical protein
MSRLERQRQDELQREPEWSRQQQFLVEEMQPRRLDSEPTSRDTILWLRSENDKLRERVATLENMRVHLETRVLPALARIYDNAECPARFHSAYTRCPDCDLRVFLETWRKDENNAR